MLLLYDSDYTNQIRYEDEAKDSLFYIWPITKMIALECKFLVCFFYGTGARTVPPGHIKLGHPVIRISLYETFPGMKPSLPSESSNLPTIQVPSPRTGCVLIRGSLP